jgi:hypothetical protein
MLGVFPCEVLYEIWISNLRYSNLDFIDNKISNKKICKLRSFITSQDLQLSCWEFLHLRPFEKFKFSNFKNSDVLYFNKSNSNKKMDQLQSSITFEDEQLLLVICSSGTVVATFFTNLRHLSHSFFKLYKRYRFCEQNYYHFVKWSNNQNKNCTYWQVMEVWNFVVYNFFIWQCFTTLKRDCWFCKGTMLAAT